MDGFNMDAPWGLYSKWNKPVMKRQISVWFNFYKSKQERERAEWGFPGSGVEELVGILLFNEYRILSIQDEKVDWWQEWLYNVINVY